MKRKKANKLRRKLAMAVGDLATAKNNLVHTHRNLEKALANARYLRAELADLRKTHDREMQLNAIVEDGYSILVQPLSDGGFGVTVYERLDGCRSDTIAEAASVLLKELPEAEEKQ